MDFRTILWDGGKLNKDFFIRCQRRNILVIVQYNVKRGEVKRLDLSRLRVMMESISEIGAPARECLLLCYDGYDNDNRELSEIPEVVEYTKRMVDAFPHVFYFLHSDVNQHIFTAIVPHKIYPHPVPAFPLPQRTVQLDIPKAQEQFAALSAAVHEYGKKVGDTQGARASIQQWRRTLHL